MQHKCRKVPILPGNIDVGTSQELKLKKVTKGPRCSDTNFDIIKGILKTNYTDTIEIEE